MKPTFRPLSDALGVYRQIFGRPDANAAKRQAVHSRPGREAALPIIDGLAGEFDERPGAPGERSHWKHGCRALGVAAHLSELGKI